MEIPGGNHKVISRANEKFPSSSRRNYWKTFWRKFKGHPISTPKLIPSVTSRNIINGTPRGIPDETPTVITDGTSKRK